jgi:hypothetical protein
MSGMSRALLVLVLITATASADRKTAERYFRAGEKAYRAQNFLAAAQNFEQAYKELPAPELAFSTAQAYRRQARVDPTKAEYITLAIKYYQLYLEQVKSGGRVGDAADSLGEMMRELDKRGAAMMKVAPVTQDVTRLGVSVMFADKQSSGVMREIDDKDAAPQVVVRTSIDGEPVEADVMIPKKPGEHVVRAEAEGYRPAEKTVRLIAGAPDIVELELQPLPARVTVKTEAGAAISVDGRAVGVVPMSAIEMAAGRHLITIVRNGRQAFGTEITVKRAAHETVEVSLTHSTRRRAVPYALLLSGGLLVASGLSGLAAWHYDSDASSRLDQLRMGDQPQEVLAAYYRSRSRREDLRTGMYVFAGSAVVAAGAAAWLYYFDTPSAEGVHLVPATSNTSVGAMMTGRF